MTCTVCNSENDHLAVVCSSCGAFLQTRIENLDLFTTAWGIVESPKATFHRIAVARHKNYAVILSAVAGFALVFGLFWYIKAGEYTDSLLSILAAGGVTGPFLGIASVLVCALLVKISSSFVDTKATYWQMYAITSYALLPVIVSVILLLPLELMTFGKNFYTRNPSPFVIKPLSYMILMGLDALFALWSVALLWVGWKSLFRSSFLKTLLVFVCSLGVFGVGAYFLISFVLPLS